MRMEKKSLHVVKASKGGWAVRRTGSFRSSSTFSSQGAALTYARKNAKSEGSEVFVHRPDGTIRDWDSYGADPHPPKR